MDRTIEINKNEFVSLGYYMEDALKKGFRFGYARASGISVKDKFFDTWVYEDTLMNSLNSIATTGDINLKTLF